MTMQQQQSFISKLEVENQAQQQQVLPPGLPFFHPCQAISKLTSTLPLVQPVLVKTSKPKSNLAQLLAANDPYAFYHSRLRVSLLSSFQ